jgi:peptide/nickel transport system permease protein
MRHLLRRVGFYVVALWASITINFIIPRLSPGNAVDAYLAQAHGKLPPQARKALEIQFGVSHDPLWAQYGQYINNLLHGQLGISIKFYPMPVTQIIAQDLPWTLWLVGMSLVISFVIGTLLGVIVAWRRNSKLDAFLLPFFTFISAIPYFWLALILLYVLGYIFGLFPLSGGYDILNISPGLTWDFITSAIVYSALPALTIVIGSIAGWMLGMRSAMITTLSEDYVVMAEAKGLPQRRVMLMYAARNAILPNITQFALSLGFVVSGSLLTETIFSYPGVGYALIQAVNGKDYALMEGLFLIITIAVLAANFLADLLYVILDPRVRNERG